MDVTFYDVGQGLSALVSLPDGRRVLVDAGEAPDRAGCGAPCADAHSRLLEGLRSDLNGDRIDLLWITHPHSDHIGGVPAIVTQFEVDAYVDNGRDGDKPLVRRTHDAVDGAGVRRIEIEPRRPAQSPLAASDGVRLIPILPSRWPDSCDRNRDPNDCSIALRIEYCASSVLFTGDAGDDEEALLDPHGPVTLLQVGHHGSETSSSESFLRRTLPRYAVISAGRRGVGTNRTYCHPRLDAVRRLDAILGDAGQRVLGAFDGSVPCKTGGNEGWVDVRTSDRLWATSRDGDVHLRTLGDGRFSRIPRNERTEVALTQKPRRPDATSSVFEAVHR